jgi:hypothetical protein
MKLFTLRIMLSQGIRRRPNFSRTFGDSRDSLFTMSDTLTLNPSTGIEALWTPFPHVAVGNSDSTNGNFARVSLGAVQQRKFASRRGESNSFTVAEGSFIRSRDKNRLLLVEDRPGENDRVGFLATVSGPRGAVATFYGPVNQVLAVGEIWHSPTGAAGISFQALCVGFPGDQFSARIFDRERGRMIGRGIRITTSLAFNLEEASEGSVTNGQFGGMFPPVPAVFVPPSRAVLSHESDPNSNFGKAVRQVIIAE